MNLSPRMRALLYFYFANFLFALNIALPLYVASSFLGRFLPTELVGIMYAAGNVLALATLPFLPGMLRRMGNFSAAISLIVIDIIATVGLALADTPLLAVFFFIIVQAVTMPILVTFDIFLERNSKDATTGSLRAIMLTVINLAVLMAPPIAALIIGESSYGKAYLVAATLLLPVLFLLARGFSGFSDARYDHPPFLTSLAQLRKHRALWNPFVAAFLLQFFFSWMVIYMPLYLHVTIGFDWQTIGLIFAIMLAPFVLFELPIGRLADSFFGEKEFMTAGFLIAGISTALIPFVHSYEPLVWAALLFVTRTGAAFVEVTSTAYFYKHVTAANAELIGFFRNTTSLAFIAGPLSASVLLFFMPSTYLFSVLGLLLIFGTRYSLSITDTK